MGNTPDAEDATQEIFIRAFEQAHRFDGRSGLYTWLYRLAVRQCLTRIKQRRSADRHARAAATDARFASGRGSVRSPIERANDREQSEFADRLLQSLPGHYRACLVLREIEGLSYARIAALLDLPPGTVMSRLSRARRILRRRLQCADADRADTGNRIAAGVVQGLEEPTRDDVF